MAIYGASVAIFGKALSIQFVLAVGLITAGVYRYNITATEYAKELAAEAGDEEEAATAAGAGADESVGLEEGKQVQPASHTEVKKLNSSAATT